MGELNDAGSLDPQTLNSRFLDPRSLDARSLAQLARDVLAAATEVTLLMTGPVRASESAILLHDEDGTPHLWCERGSVVAAAARLRQPAVLTVVSRQRLGSPSGRSGPLTLALAGRLTHVRSSSVTGQLIDVVALAPVRVAIDVGREPNVETYTVPLAAYATATPDPITAYAARAVNHTNTCHHRELRQYVSERFGLPTEVIAGAMLAHLDRYGAVSTPPARTRRPSFSDRPRAVPSTWLRSFVRISPRRRHRADRAADPASRGYGIAGGTALRD
jgi:hypothetical protein